LVQRGSSSPARANVSAARRDGGARGKASGDRWEDTLSRLLNILKARKLATWFRTPEKLRRIRPLSQPGHWDCVAVSEGPPDYILVSQGRAIALEAKQTAASRWPLKLLADHQAAALDAWEEHQGVGAVALQLGQVELVIPWRVLGPRWHAHRARTGRAASGEASLDLATATALGALSLDVEGRWLLALTRSTA
jgi:hypothetical protein